MLHIFLALCMACFSHSCFFKIYIKKPQRDLVRVSIQQVNDTQIDTATLGWAADTVEGLTGGLAAKKNWIRKKKLKNTVKWKYYLGRDFLALVWIQFLF